MRNSLRRALSSPAVIVAVAFALRMGLLFYFTSSWPAVRSGSLTFGYETGRVARAIAAGEGFSSPLNVNTGPTAWFTPVYPYLLAGVFKLFGTYTAQSLLVIQTLNCAFSALACLPVFFVGRRVFGPTVAAWSGWVWTLLPSAVIFPILWVWDTSLSALLMGLLLWATLSLRHSTNVQSWVGYGLLWALAVLTNPSFLSLLPFLLSWLAFQASKQVANWRRLVGAATMVFVFGVSPWIVRNYLTFEKLVLFRSNFGLELYLGNNEYVPDSWSWWLHPNDNDEEREKFRRMGEIAYMAEKQHEALHFIANHPRDVLRFLFHRFVNNWTGAWDPIADVWSTAPWYLRGNYLLSWLFSVLAFLGLFFASRARKRETVPFAVVLLVFPLVYYITHTSLRYRHPIDPVMTVLAVYAVAYPISKRVQLFADGPASVSGPPVTEELSAAK